MTARFAFYFLFSYINSNLYHYHHQVFRFCASKCHKNFKHKCNPRRKRWTKAFRKANGKELTVDATFEFEKHRHAPAKYSRTLFSKSVEGMKRVEMIRQKREAAFIQKRQAKAELIEREKDRKEVARDMSLIRSAQAGLRVPKPKRAKVLVLNDAEMEEEDEEDGVQNSDSEEEEMLQDSDAEQAEAILN